jgi:hypothetical protein
MKADGHGWTLMRSKVRRVARQTQGTGIDYSRNTSSKTTAGCPDTCAAVFVALDRLITPNTGDFTQDVVEGCDAIIQTPVQFVEEI